MQELPPRGAEPASMPVSELPASVSVQDEMLSVTGTAITDRAQLEPDAADATEPLTVNGTTQFMPPFAEMCVASVFVITSVVPASGMAGIAMPRTMQLRGINMPEA